MPLLAQIAPPPDGVEAWLKVLFWLAGGLVAIAAAIRILTGKNGVRQISPQPLEVKEHATVVTIDQLETVKKEAHGRMNRERAEIDANIRRVEEAAQSRSEKIEGKIDENTRMTATMSGQVTQMNQQLHQLTNSVTNFISRQAQP